MLATILLALSVLGLSLEQSTKTDTTCRTGLYMLVARGSCEPMGGGEIGRFVADHVLRAIPDSEIVPLPYPAMLNFYIDSEGAGVGNMTELIEEYVGKCPQGKVALLGYSQGGQIIMDTLCGTSEQYFPNTTAIAASYAPHIVAAITYGDPSHTVGLPWNRGTSKRTGLFPRRNTTACNPLYANKIRGWCDAGDKYCDGGGNVTGTHQGYFGNYSEEAVRFIVGRYNEAAEFNNTNAITTTMVPSPTTTETSDAGLLGLQRIGLWACVAVAAVTAFF